MFSPCVYSLNLSRFVAPATDVIGRNVKSFYLKHEPAILTVLWFVLINIENVHAYNNHDTDRWEIW